MITELWRKIWPARKPTSPRNGQPKVLKPLEALNGDYYRLRRLAEQIHAHADKAPYDHVAKLLQQVAAEKRKTAYLLKERISVMGGKTNEPEPNVQWGKNHWERMVLDLEDQKALGNALLEQAVRFADDAPEVSEFLRGIAAAQAPHKQILLDLIARADPQAHQT